MSSPRYLCVEHVVPGQHIRNYSRAASREQEAVFQLAVKQYTPQYPTGPEPADITILACHASGVPKETYEPVWDELFDYTTATTSFRIRNIWVVDVYNQGASGILNENILGNEPSWFDHARDLLAVVNHFRADMPRPIVGFGHSLGGANILSLALLHPRLLTTIVVFEPMVIRHTQWLTNKAGYFLNFKKDTWQNDAQAAQYFRQNPFYKSWDPRTLDIWMKYGLRELPPSSPGGDKPVTLATTKYQESLTFSKAAYPSKKHPLSKFVPTSQRHPDITSDRRDATPFYRPETMILFDNLPSLRPSCYFIYGSRSSMISAKETGRKDKLDVTGTGIGGNGGVRSGRVADHILDGSHFLPQENPAALAQDMGKWFTAHLVIWRREEKDEATAWGAVPVEERSKFEPDWLYWMNQQHREKREKREKASL